MALPFVLLLQWTMPAMEYKRDTPFNFSDITFEKCNDPEHSHPPLSQRKNPDDLEKLVNSELNNSFIANCFQKYFYSAQEIIFDKLERYPESLFRHFAPSRSPPFLEV